MRHPAVGKGHRWKIGGIWSKCVVSLKEGSGDFFPLKSQYLVVNIFGFVSHVISSETTSPRHWSWKERQHVNEWAWLYSNKTLNTKPGSGLAMACEPSFLTPGQ